MPASVDLEDGTYGPRAVLLGPWSSGLADYLREHEVVELELNHAKGWQGADLDFLKELPDLLAFTIIDMTIDSILPIHTLHRLRSLNVVTYYKTPIDFGAFPALEDVGLEWRPGSDSLFACKHLKRLFVNRSAARTFEGFAQLRHLRELTILGGHLRNVTGIGHLKALVSLRLGNLRSLDSIEEVGDVRTLGDLQVELCRRITKLDRVGELANLKVLVISDCGSIESLRPVSGLEKLETAIFDGSTNIVDGDLSPLLLLPELKKVSFQNRRHYTHRREDFRAYREG